VYLRTVIDTILAEEVAAPSEERACERIEALTEEHTWSVIFPHLRSVLEDEQRPVEHWELTAEVLWGAVLDGRKMPEARIVALLHVRLPPDPNSTESNLAWSIICRLKGVYYLSSYDPAADHEVQTELQSVRKL
jgi:hypothetical protein